MISEPKVWPRHDDVEFSRLPPSDESPPVPQGRHTYPPRTKLLQLRSARLHFRSSNILIIHNNIFSICSYAQPSRSPKMLHKDSDSISGPTSDPTSDPGQQQRRRDAPGHVYAFTPTLRTPFVPPRRTSNSPTVTSTILNHLIRRRDSRFLFQPFRFLRLIGR